VGERKEETPAFSTATASCRSAGARAGEKRGVASAREARRGELEQRSGWGSMRGGGARCFFEMHTTIANITDEDVIRYFQNGLFSKHMYHDFGRNRPTTAVELRDTMARWAN
jgi:hypothetical protein